MEKWFKFALIVFSVMLLSNSFCFYNAVTKSNVPIATGTKFSIREDSQTRARPMFFFSPFYRSRQRTIGGGGIGVGK